MKRRLFFILQPFIKFPLFNSSVAFCIGIVCAYYFNVKNSLLLIIIVTFILVLLNGRFWRKYLVSLGLFTLFTLIGILRFQLYEFSLESKKDIREMFNKEVTVSGVIVSPVEDKGDYKRLTINIKSIMIIGNSGSISRVTQSMLVYVNDCKEVLQYGDKLVIRGLLEEPPELEDFSYKEYLQTQGIYSILKRGKVESVESGGEENSFQLKLMNFKVQVSNKIKSILTEPHASLLSGIIYGVEGSIGDGFSDYLRKTGTTHIIAVSGYNITVLISSIGVFSSFIGRRRLAVFSILFVVLFMFFVGVDNIPVVRASLMGIVLMISQIIGRKRGILIFMPFTVAIFLLLNPLTFKQISFQLSFLSTLGLIFSTDAVQAKLGFIPEAFREDVASTFSAILFTTPITLTNFGQFSMIAPVANFFVLPTVPMITVGGFVLIIIVLLSPFIAEILAYFFWLILEYMVRVIELFGRLDFAMVEINDNISNIISFVLIIILVYISIELSYRKAEKVKKDS